MELIASLTPGHVRDIGCALAHIPNHKSCGKGVGIFVSPLSEDARATLLQLPPPRFKHT